MTQQVPEQWTTRRLKRAVDLVNDRADTNSSSYIGLEHVEPWTGRLLDSPGDPEPAGSTSRFQPGDILFGKLRPYLAKVVHATFPGCCSPELLVLRPRVHDPRYLQYVLLTDEFIRRVDATTYGSKMPRANWADIGAFIVPVPPLTRQRAIADFLDEKTPAIDALIAKKQRLIDLIEEKRQAAITRAVTKGLDPVVPMTDSGVEWLGEVPAHWRVVQVRRAIAESTYGISETLEPDGCVPVLRMGNISRGAVVLEDLKYVERVDGNLLLRSGDLLFNRTNSLELVGRTGLYRAGEQKHVTFASYLVRFRTNEHADPEYLNYLLNTPPVLQVARAMAIPAIGQANLSPSRYADLRICLPPRDEQRRIVSYIGERDRQAERVKSLLIDHVLKLKEYRQALISSAVTGQIDVGTMAHSPAPDLEEAFA